MFSLFTLGCGQTGKRPDVANMECHEFFVQGQMGHDEYTFCGIEPVKSSYTFKQGFWRYWNKGGDLVAEGEYVPKSETITNQGGCDYDIFVSTIIAAKWRFWDENGKLIEPDDDLISRISSCK